MIRLAQVVDRFGDSLRHQMGSRLLPSHHRALAAMGRCRTSASRQMLVQCSGCDHRTLIPHSCGHRLCPHCQSFESQRWLERQQRLRMPCEYFLLTFTVPREYRGVAFAHQRAFYDALMCSAWQTLKTFTANDNELKGTAGAVAVLHTNTRRLDYHPHVHLVVPAGAINSKDKHWRTRKKRGYLFNGFALGKVFRGKLMAQLDENALTLPESKHKQWVVDCKSVGGGDKALSYLGRYLYKGVVREKDIIGIKGEQVTFRYTENNGCVRTRTLSGAQFLWLLLQHTLPKGFRRARNYGFLHHNSQRLIRLIQLLLLKMGLVGPRPKRDRPAILCGICGATMRLVAVGLNWEASPQDTEPRSTTETAVM